MRLHGRLFEHDVLCPIVCVAALSPRAGRDGAAREREVVGGGLELVEGVFDALGGLVERDEQRREAAAAVLVRDGVALEQAARAARVVVDPAKRPRNNQALPAAGARVARRRRGSRGRVVATDNTAAARARPRGQRAGDEVRARERRARRIRRHAARRLRRATAPWRAREVDPRATVALHGFDGRAARPEHRAAERSSNLELDNQRRLRTTLASPLPPPLHGAATTARAAAAAGKAATAAKAARNHESGVG